MRESEDEGKAPSPRAMAGGRRLPYAVELWNLTRTGPERIIGRASSPVLARAIFTAAQSEHLGRRIVLRRGSEILAQSE